MPFKVGRVATDSILAANPQTQLGRPFNMLSVEGSFGMQDAAGSSGVAYAPPHWFLARNSMGYESLATSKNIRAVHAPWGHEPFRVGCWCQSMIRVDQETH
jgi:hypothetical protein